MNVPDNAKEFERLLMGGANLDAKDEKGNTALMVVAESGNNFSSIRLYIAELCGTERHKAEGI